MLGKNGDGRLQDTVLPGVSAAGRTTLDRFRLEAEAWRDLTERPFIE